MGKIMEGVFRGKAHDFQKLIHITQYYETSGKLIVVSFTLYVIRLSP
jgi:hypothetical protein